ncbi:RecQ family ATP-dependent DNA helicase [Chamaesiphon minutus]|uniref:ATP-dependent DNA helicase RecQ n=1 Tax=Chamaesiphon minutus (strain ATCC 27169 / PCC 6605) TaxID=1173020 RepID=K9U9S6_CHAP6|nr:ATP-dependent DNA helicase RecQ [Chamaesiphon minutus]AFY91353.1 ATP-dependent DNA helicase, RecQ family [Chamaesiphon minutus PCC 6605]
MDRIHAKLQQVWGYDRLRTPQGEIIDCLLQQRDALIVMPTGGGKSLCFQLPALLSEGVTLVISPLVALMENQVQELIVKGVAAGLLHSEIPTSERSQTLRRLASHQLKLLYLSPETLLSTPVWEKLCDPELKIDRLVIDEAHCLVHWGETFRPTYRRLGAIRATLIQSKPLGTKISIAAFTATADPRSQQTIERVLQLDKPAKFLLTPYRPNLHLSVNQIWTPSGRKHRLIRFIDKYPQQSGLIYVRTRDTSAELAAWLAARGDTTAAYHAGLSPQARRRLEGDWLSGKLQYVVCTCAFGMGINKANVRWIAHFHPPVLLAEYIQEIGRAGRDGQPSEALLLACESTGLLYPEDRQRNRFFTESVDRYYNLATAMAKKLPASGDIQQIERQFPKSAVALSLLHSVGELAWETPFKYRRTITGKSPDWKLLRSQHQQLFREVPTYITESGCRWKYLLTAFGAKPAQSNWRCGRCDRCLAS